MEAKVFNEVKRIIRSKYGKINKGDLDWYKGLCSHFCEEILEGQTFKDVVNEVVDVIEMEKAEV